MEGQLDAERLIRRRDELKAEITQIGDMRPGSLTPRFRKCGKPSCHCSSDTSPGHGPSWSLTREINGKTVTKIIPSSAAVETTKKQISEFKRFRELCRELIEVSAKLCDIKLETLKADATATAQKGGIKNCIEAQGLTEIHDNLVRGRLDGRTLEALESLLKETALF